MNAAFLQLQTENTYRQTDKRAIHGTFLATNAEAFVRWGWRVEGTMDPQNFSGSTLAALFILY